MFAIARAGAPLAVESPVLQAQAAPAPSAVQYVVFFVVIIGIMYFLIWMPQQRERKAREDLVSSLAKDDRVVTSSGLHGRIVSVGEATVVLEIAEKTRVTIDKAAVARKEGKP